MENPTENGLVTITYGEEVNPSERFKSRRHWKPNRGATVFEKCDRAVWRAIDALEGAQDLGSSLSEAIDMIAIGFLVACYTALFALVFAWALS